MSNASIELLFPKPLYIVEGLCTTELCTFENLAHEIVKDGVNRSEEFQVSTTNQINNNVLDYAGLEELKSIILEHSKKFMEALEYDKSFINNASIVDSILNISNAGDYLFPHTHGVCLLAGVFYIKAPKESKIWFYDDLQKIERSYSANVLSTAASSKSYDCVAGRLIIFKPDFIHANKAQPDGEKIAISFKIN